MTRKPRLNLLKMKITNIIFAFLRKERNSIISHPTEVIHVLLFYIIFVNYKVIHVYILNLIPIPIPSQGTIPSPIPSRTYCTFPSLIRNLRSDKILTVFTLFVYISIEHCYSHLIYLYSPHVKEKILYLSIYD